MQDVAAALDFLHTKGEPGLGLSGWVWLVASGTRERDRPGRRLGAGAASRHTQDGEGPGQSGSYTSDMDGRWLWNY